MGIFDQVKDAASKMMGLPDSNLTTLIGGVSDLLNQQGGISGLSQKFQQGGMGQLMASWISTGKNLPISADQIQNVLGNDALQALAQKTGLNMDTVKQQLAQHLPNVIDKLTPDGKVPQGGISLEQLMSVGKSLLSKQS